MTYYKYELATIETSAHLSDAIDITGFTKMSVEIPATWTAASLGVHGADSYQGPFQALMDKDGNPVQAHKSGGLSASTTYIMPDEVFHVPYIKIWSTDGSGSNTAQASATQLKVILS